MGKFLIYKSSAGSGKTYTLVKEYLKLVLNNPEDFRHTLAVTFTNKAADEMKSRIIERLKELANGLNKELEKTLIKEGVKSNIKENAQLVLDNILHRYSYFSVSTIDSFFHKVIRSFARELKLQLGYEILLDEDEALNKAVDDMLADIGIDKDLTEYLESFVYNNIDDNRGWKIDFLIKSLAKEIFKERFWEKTNGAELNSNFHKESVKSLINELYGITNQFEKTNESISDEARLLLKKNGLGLEDFYQGKKGVMHWLANIIRTGGDSIKINSYALTVHSNPLKLVALKSTKKIDDSLKEKILCLLSDAVGNFTSNLRKYNSARILIKTIYIHGIFKDLLEKLKVFRDDNRLFLISDTNNVLKEIISGEESPFIYEKIGNKYKHFLIDEFQDTSRFQWDNLLPLIINSLSENNSVTIVGDIKQSIYRWRGGNMMLLQEGITKDLVQFSSQLKEEHLTENFRSRKEIVDFNNRFFEKAPTSVSLNINDISARQSVIDFYKDCKQSTGKCKDGGYVNITFIEKNKDEELSQYDKANQRLLEIIEEALNDDFKLKDITILVRRKVEANLVSKFLLEKKIKTVSDESLLLFNSPKIKLLINLLKFISDHKNELARTEVLFHYLVHIKRENPDLNEIFNDYKVKENSLFFTKLPENFFKKENTKGKKTKKIKSSLNNLTLYELIENLIGIFDLNKEADPYLIRFQDMLIEYMSKNPSDISSFLKWWEENKSDYSINIPDEIDAIRVLTIHKAKGLQNSVVILPYTNWGIDIKSSKELIWVSSDEEPFNKLSAYLVKAVKQLSASCFSEDYNKEALLTKIDNLNLLYVAFTRAKERLYSIVIEKNKQIGELVKNVIIEEFQGNFDNTNGVFEIGKKEKFKDAAILEYNFIKLGICISSIYYSKLVIKPLNKNLQLAFSKEFKDKTNRGLLIHKALSYIKTPDDLEKSMSILLNEGLITVNDLDELRNDIENLLKLDGVKNWFTGDWLVKTEAELLMPDGSVLKPDRVMLKEDKAIIVDYKTGSFSEEHNAQLNSYGDALKKAGYKQIEKYILYTQENKVVKV